MLTVSLHGIRVVAPDGLYSEESILHNEFEIDVDVYILVGNSKEWPFADYTIINQTVLDAFKAKGQLLETLVQHIHAGLKNCFAEAGNIRVTVRKLHPPMPGQVGYAQVCYEG